MKTLSRFESQLLLIARGLVRGNSVERIWAPLVTEHDRPKCLSRDAVELLQETLAKGCIRWLARHGGWRTGRFMRGESPNTGRLWERTKPTDLALKFSENALEFLIWLTKIDARTRTARLSNRTEPIQIGDRFLYYLACRTCRDTEIFANLTGQPQIGNDALISLAYFDLLPRTAPNDPEFFQPWLTEPGSSLLESLQPVIADHLWDREMARMGLKADEMHRRAGAQAHIFGGFLEAIDAQGRRDLALLFLPIARRLLAARPASSDWTEFVKVGDLRLADRLKAYASATTFLTQFLRLQTWDEDARRVGYYDEGYHASQLWKSLWEEQRGEELALRARAILRELEPLAV